MSGASYRNTILLARPFLHCRCYKCTFDIRQQIEAGIYEPVEPLMIPTLSPSFSWSNVRLPNKLLDPLRSLGAEYIYVDEDVMSFLEKKKVINWCKGLRQLHPIWTTGDGNCLVHAVILATCGIQDSGLVLRRLIYVALVESVSNSFRKRWQKEKQRLNESIPGGLQYTPEEWNKEWSMVVNAAEDLRKTKMSYEYLEEMHVFVLANVICRPIIILGESTVRSPLAGDSIEQNNFVGIYLPLLWGPKYCDRNPVVLCFLHNHFQPLISRYTFVTERQDILAIPLVTSRLEPLHIHFLLPEEEPKAHELLQRYLYTLEVERLSEDGSSREAILAAEILYTARHHDWENSDYMYHIGLTLGQIDARKVTQSPSKSSLNYTEPAKGDCMAYRTSNDVIQRKHLATECCHCRGKKQKSIGFDKSQDHSDQSKICPKCPKCHDQNHHDHLSSYLDNADWNRKPPSKNLTGIGQDYRNSSQKAQSTPNNVMIFNALKNLKSTQQEENAIWRAGTAGLRVPASQSTKLGNSKSSAAGNQSQLRRRLSDISDADVKYIQKKFTIKTPIYCRSLALLGKQCAKPDCNRFVENEIDFCCAFHANPTSPPDATKCILAGCSNLGLLLYSGMCSECFYDYVYENSWSDREEQFVQTRSRYVYDRPQGSTPQENSDTSVESAKTQLLKQYSISSDKSDSVADALQKYLLIPPRKSDKHLEALVQGNMQSQKVVATEGVEHGQIRHRVYEKSEDSADIEENIDDCFDKLYPPKNLGHGAFPSEHPISGMLHSRNESVSQDREEVETIAGSDCIKNEKSFRGGNEQVAIAKDDGISSSPKNVIKRSTNEGKVEASKKHLPPVTAVESLPLSTGSETYGELSSDDIGPVDAVLPCSTESRKGLWTLSFTAPDVDASGDESSDWEEFQKCLSTSCEHIAMDSVAGGYCTTCHTVRSLGNTGVSKQLVTMPTQAYANHSLQSPQPKPVGSAKRCDTKTKEMLKSLSTSSGFTRRAEPCLRTSCDRYGDPVYRGYCSQCTTQFENSTMEIDSC